MSERPICVQENRQTISYENSQIGRAILDGDADDGLPILLSLGPGGGNSAPATFDVDNPTPTLTDISPNAATHGAASFTLTATSTNFVSTSRIQWNGVSLATKFDNSTTLTAVIKNTDIATAGTANVTVETPAPGGDITAHKRLSSIGDARLRCGTTTRISRPTS
jgi:hypothetical protein